MLIVKANVRKAAGNFEVASEFIQALDKKVEHIIKEAVERARANNRHTLMARDV